MRLASGAWMKVAWQIAASVNAMSFGGEPVEPYQFDPYGLLQESKPQECIAPYNPAVLQALQDSGKFR